VNSPDGKKLQKAKTDEAIELMWNLNIILKIEIKTNNFIRA
jgi:hypothetical protein